MKRLFLMVFACWAVSTASDVRGSATSPNVYRITYRVPGDGSYGTTMFLAVPLEPIASPWSQFRRTRRTDDADNALVELLGAIYEGRYDDAAKRIAGGNSVVARGGLHSYVDAFRKSLPPENDL